MAYDGKLLARARLRLQDIKSENQAEQYRRQARSTQSTSVWALPRTNWWSFRNACFPARMIRRFL